MDGDWHCLNCVCVRFGCRVSEFQPLGFAVLHVIDVFMFQNTKVGRSDEGVNHELDEVLHLIGDGDSLNCGLLLGEFVCTFAD